MSLLYEDLHSSCFATGERYQIHLPDALVEATLVDKVDLYPVFALAGAAPSMLQLCFRHVLKLQGSADLLLHPGDNAFVHNYQTGTIPMVQHDPVFRLRHYRGFEEIKDVPVLAIVSARKARMIHMNFKKRKVFDLVSRQIVEGLSKRIPEEVARKIREYHDPVEQHKLPKF
jgi:hypothetical protein